MPENQPGGGAQQSAAESRSCKESRAFKTSRVFPGDVNNHDTLFGGKLMAYIDDIASISASRHSRRSVVTASTDSVDFLRPIMQTDSVGLEAYVTWTGRTSMEVFVKITTENLLTGERNVAATSFLTFVALDEAGKPVSVPGVVPESEEERKMHETAPERAEARRRRREQSQRFAQYLSLELPWE